MVFKVNRHNIKQAISIQLTFIPENKLQKEHFLAIYDCFFSDLCIHFEPLLGWKCSYVCRKKLTVKSEIKDKQLA